MTVVSVTLRNFRTYESVRATLGPGITVVSGPNGAGKTNLLEALYFGCTGRSCRTINDRELVRFGSTATRVTVRCEDDAGPHELAVGFAPGEPKRMTADGAPVERLLDAPCRPLVSVFLPDRLELIKGAPALRRAHIDHLVAALWPARAANRRAYGQALAQRNALLVRIRSGHGSKTAISTWDLHLAQAAVGLMADRRAAVELVCDGFRDLADRLGLDGGPSISYGPRSTAADPAAFVAELEARLESDLDRGFTGHGPHRDEVLIARVGRELRTYGSQGQQRLGLLALLLAEREAISSLRAVPPLLLLDDVMSELDSARRTLLVEILAAGPGQVVITTTDLDHVPLDADVAGSRIAITGAGLIQEAVAA